MTTPASETLDPLRTALLVIDMQDEFVRPEWSPFWVPAATRMAPRLCGLIEHCRKVGVPVIPSACPSATAFSIAAS